MNLLTRRFLSEVAASLVAVALVSFAACGDAPTTHSLVGDSDSRADSKYSVYGSITSGGKAVGGVTVTSSTSSVESDSGGNYRIGLVPGDHVLTFSKDGYVDAKLSVTVATEPEQRVNVVMTAGAGGGVGSGETLVASSGVRLERRVAAEGRLEFDITGMDDPNPEEKRHIAWGYEPGQSFTGGRGGDGAEWGLRTYKIKVFEVNGHYISEPRYNIDWDPNATYHVVIEWSRTSVSAEIGGAGVGVSASYPGDWIVGIGWPPAVRQGVDGLTYSNIVWPAGSTPAN